MFRLIKCKLLNGLTKNGNKFNSEKLLKNSLKCIIKNNKKSCKIIIFLALNFCLPAFNLETRLFKTKKIKLLKIKPIFILTMKQKIYYSLKFIISLSRKKNSIFFKNFKNQLILTVNLKNGILYKKIQTQEQAILSKNVLTFYRWK